MCKLHARCDTVEVTLNPIPSPPIHTPPRTLKERSTLFSFYAHACVTFAELFSWTYTLTTVWGNQDVGFWSTVESNPKMAQSPPTLISCPRESDGDSTVYTIDNQTGLRGEWIYPEWLVPPYGQVLCAKSEQVYIEGRISVNVRPVNDHHVVTYICEWNKRPYGHVKVPLS